MGIDGTTNWTYWACDFRTGRAIAELPFLQGVSAKLHLDKGELQGQLILDDLSDLDRLEALEFTTPLKYSIAIDRNGECIGEWLIWRRSLPWAAGQAITIGGSSALKSYLDTRQVPALTYTNVDQFSIARALVLAACSGAPVTGAGSVAVTVPVQASGVLRTRTYLAREAYTGTRLKELSEVEGGFDVIVDADWVAGPGNTRYVQRTVRFSSPRAGEDTSQVFYAGGVGGSGGNLLGLQVDQDGTKLASQAWAIGSGEGTDKVVGQAITTALTDQGYPFTETSASWGSVIDQGTINGHAAESLALGQVRELPPTVSVRANEHPVFGEYALGDRVWLQAGPTPNFPEGYFTRVRILGMTLRPKAPGDEVVALEVTTYNA